MHRRATAFLSPPSVLMLMEPSTPRTVMHCVPLWPEGGISACRFPFEGSLPLRHISYQSRLVIWTQGGGGKIISITGLEGNNWNIDEDCELCNRET